MLNVHCYDKSYLNPTVLPGLYRPVGICEFFFGRVVIYWFITTPKISSYDWSESRNFLRDSKKEFNVK